MIPAAALHAGNQVFLVDAEQRLDKQQLEVVWHDGESVVVNNGLNAGDRLVLTPISSKLAGSKVIIAGEKLSGKPE